MSTNKQRRESERQRLQRQLEERRQREVARRRFTTIASIVGALVLVAAIVVIVVVAGNSGDDKKKDTASKPSTTPTAAPSSSAASTCGQTTFPTKKYPAATGAAVSFDGVTVKGATDLKGKPQVTSTAKAAATKLAYKDLVVGKGTPAGPTSCVTVQYDGVLYVGGKEFDSSWQRGQLAEFPLTGVVPGFTQGIGGSTSVPAMKVGGRRVVIVPAALGYGSQANNGIPANSTLVFVIDLVSVRSS